MLRRIMRRAMRHAYQMGATEPLMPRLVPALVRQMGQAYPELGRAQALMTDTLRLEETRFRSLLERGLHLLAEETGRLGEGETLAGSVAFRLYDTFGFPLDLTQDALREQGRAVDLAGFEAAMAEQRTRARAAWAGSGDAATDRVWFDLKRADRRHRVPRLCDGERRRRDPRHRIGRRAGGERHGGQRGCRHP